MPGLALAALLVLGGGFSAQQAGSIRGTVYDKDFDVPLAAAQVAIFETGQTATASDQGSYLLGQVPPGTYTLVFAKEGYARQVRSDVVVSAGQLVEIDAWLSGEFIEMEEFVVQDILDLGAGSEVALLQLRFESPALMDSIGADLMSKAGASDAAAALKLVAGATVREGKSAVIRGLPDRYVSSQMNSVRLPSADEDKRAVELDQFPAAVIESIQVSKTFTPDQQGDASGGAVDVRLRGIPEESVLQFRAQLGYNSNAGFRDDFLTYEGGGFDSLGHDDQDRVVQPDGNWEGAVAATEDDSPVDYKFALDAGRRWELGSGMKIGGFASLFYERDSSFNDDYVDNSLIRENREDPMTPEIVQGQRNPDNTGDYKTALFDIEQASQSVRLGGLATIGLETESHALALTYLYTRNTTDTATVATDTRGKEFFFPGHDPDDPTSPGHESLESAPYIRTDTLLFSERNSDTLQLSGRHALPVEGLDVGSALRFGKPELDWTLAHSTASLDQPDGRLFSAIWQPFGVDSGIWSTYKPAASNRLGNLQRTFEELEEVSDQYLLDLKLPFEQWNGKQGYFKLGLFGDELERTYEQDTFSNFDDISFFVGDFDDPWSEVFPDENHPISASDEDIDYDGEQDISAWYAMVDTPLSETVSLVAGVRFESTEISTIIHPEAGAQWLNPDGIGSQEALEPGEADVFFEQDDVLPAFGLTYQPTGPLTFRASYAETIARQTFKELTPVLVYEYSGGPVFTGNPDLQMSSLKNYDLRADYTPREGSFLSLSWFYKDIDDPIEYVQVANPFVYTTAANYPEGELSGYEIEVRQDLDRFAEVLEGLSIGANATFIDSEVTLPADEAQILEEQLAPEPTRDATNAPEYLYNLYVTYEHERTQVSLFYTVQGDTLLAGAGAKTGSIGYVPDVYQEDYGTLNLVISRQIGKRFRLKFEAKNLTDPDIETVYRSDFIGGDVTKSSYSTGREFSISLSANL